MNKLIGSIGSALGSVSRQNDRVFYAAVATISLGTGLVNALSAAQDAVKRGAIYDVRTPLLWEMTSILVIILLAPLLLVTVRTLRRSPVWASQAAIALAAILAFSMLHIAGMVGLRKLVLWAAGGSYDFHLSLATLVYELRKDVLTVILMGSALWLFDRAGDASPGGPAAGADRPAPTPAALWLRDGARRLRISPAEILWINSAGNYIEYELACGRRHLIRGTLSAAETGLAGLDIVRIHRGRLANLARVTAVAVRPSGDFDLTFDTGHMLQGSRRYRSAIATLEGPSDGR